MSKSGMLQAVDALLALTTVALRATEAAQQASEMIQRAQSEDRDLNEAEIAQLRKLRAEAMERWNRG